MTRCRNCVHWVFTQGWKGNCDKYPWPKDRFSQTAVVHGCPEYREKCPLTAEEPELLFDDNQADIDMDCLRDSLKRIQWADVGKWLREHYQVTGPSVRAMVMNLSPQQQAEVAAEVLRRLEEQG